MPLEIVRNNIADMQVDAIVNTANPRPIIGQGVDSAIHRKAGPKLLEMRRKIGNIEVGCGAISPAYGLDAKYVIHTVGPVWQGGGHGEELLLRSCYREALRLAREKKCKSIAFPLISSGTYGFPKDLALQAAIGEISSFLLKREMQVYLVVFDRDAFGLSEKLFQSVQSYIDERYIRDKTLDEYGSEDWEEAEPLLRRRRIEALRCEEETPHSMVFTAAAPTAGAKSPSVRRLEDLLKETDAGFSETLLRLIDRTGKKDSEVYKKANIDRKLFSKIRNNRDYKPSKATVLAFAVALELTLEETKDLLSRAGFALTRSSKLDIIVEYFISNRNYNIFEINEVLFAFDQSLLGS